MLTALHLPVHALCLDKIIKEPFPLQFTRPRPSSELELELIQIQTQMTQKPMLRAEPSARACDARKSTSSIGGA